MKKFDPTQLSYFTGTEKYYRISRRHLLTDGTNYLAEEAECFWMMDAIASHLAEIGTADWFVQVRMTVNEKKATSAPASTNERNNKTKSTITNTVVPCACMADRNGGATKKEYNTE